MEEEADIPLVREDGVARHKVDGAADGEADEGGVEEALMVGENEIVLFFVELDFLRLEMVLPRPDPHDGPQKGKIDPVPEFDVCFGSVPLGPGRTLCSVHRLLRFPTDTVCRLEKVSRRIERLYHKFAQKTTYFPPPSGKSMPFP